MSKFSTDKSGVIELRKSKHDDSYYSVRICAPIAVTARTRDANGHNWGLLLKWKDADGGQKRWNMPQASLASGHSEVIAYLLAGGLLIEPGEAKTVIEYIQEQDPSARLTIVNQIGWYQDSFVLPDLPADSKAGLDDDRIISDTSDTNGTGIELCYAPETGSTNSLFGLSGTTDEWRRLVAEPCQLNSRLLFSVSAAFSGPTLRMLGEEGGGFHFHHPSSVGKSTCLLAAGSVYGGGGIEGFLRKWRATANGLELTAAAHNDCLLALDELGQLLPADAVQVAYLLAGGQAKARMNANGTEQKQRTWRLQFLSSGELTIDQLAQSIGQKTRGGMEVRLVNIAADAGAGLGAFECLHGSVNGNHFSDRLQEAAKKYYGSVGIDWLCYLVQSREQCELQLRRQIDRFMMDHTPKGAIGEVVRVVRRFAVVAAAGEVATMLDLTGWDEGAANWAAAKCLAAWLAQRGAGTHEGHDTDQMIRKVREFLELHGASRFQTLAGRSLLKHAKHPGTIYRQAGFKRTTDNQSIYYFSCEVFRTEVCKGFDHKQVLAALHKAGHLIKDGGRWDKQIGTEKRGRFYAVKDSLLTNPGSDGDECSPR